MTTSPLQGAVQDGANAAPPTRAERRRLRRRRRTVLLSVLTLVALAVATVAVVLTLKTANMSSKVFGGGGSVVGLVAPANTPLRTDANGRVNVLIFGTSQDDPGHVQGEGGQGMWLTDAIQVLSIDPASGTAAMVAVPRDTWVKITDKCLVGSAGKINSVYECGTGHFDTEQAKIPDYQRVDARGADALAKAVGTVTGLVPQYWVHVNYTVLSTSVEAVGGIDVEIIGNGHEGIFDTGLDGDGCPHEQVSCRRVYYPRDGVYHLSGQQALDLARARGDVQPRSCQNFGLNGGDFDRQANQQKILSALRARAVSAGTLANPAALSGLIDALGDNVTTNLSTDEARTAVDLARRLGTMTSISLVDPAHPVLTTGSVGQVSVVKPVAGTFEYAAVHAYVQSRIAAITAAATGSTAAPSQSSSAPTSAPKGTTATTGGSGSGAPSSASPTTSRPKSTYEPPASCWGG